VRKGVTFRQAHEIVGKMVLLAIEQKKELHELTLGDMRGFARQIDEDVYEWLDPLLSPARRNNPGGTGPAMVANEIDEAKRELGMDNEKGTEGA